MIVSNNYCAFYQKIKMRQNVRPYSTVAIRQDTSDATKKKKKKKKKNLASIHSSKQCPH